MDFSKKRRTSTSHESLNTTNLDINSVLDIYRAINGSHESFKYSLKSRKLDLTSSNVPSVLTEVDEGYKNTTDVTPKHVNGVGQERINKDCFQHLIIPIKNKACCNLPASKRKKTFTKVVSETESKSIKCSNKTLRTRTIPKSRSDSNAGVKTSKIQRGQENKYWTAEVCTSISTNGVVP